MKTHLMKIKIKGVIDRLHFDMLAIFFCIFVYNVLCGTNRLYARLSLLFHGFERLGHCIRVCVHQGNISAAAGLEPGTPRL